VNCAVYIRKSREDKSKPAHRLTVQREQLPAYAQSQGWSPVIYDDGYASAARGKAEDLQQRNRLEDDVRSGKINVILTIELSRLSRDDSMQDYTSWLHLCSQYGVKLATMTRTLDPSQHSDWMLLLMEGGFSSVEMKVLQQRMAEGQREAIKQGRYIWGRPPIPYVIDRASKEIIIDPEQHKEVEMVLAMAETMSVHRIAQETDLPVIKIRRMIEDDRLLFYQGKKHDPETGELINGQWPAIINAERAATIKSARRTRKPYGKNREAGGLLSNLEGILQCGYCGRTAKAWRNSRRKKDGTRNDYYGCGHSCDKSRMVQQQIIDQKVITNLQNTLDNIDKLKQAFLEQRNAAGSATDQLKDIARKEKELTEKKTRLVMAITEGVISFADAKDTRQKIDKDLDELTLERQKIITSQQPEPDWKALQITAEEWQVMTNKERRKHILNNIRSIRIFHSYILLEYAYPRDLSGKETARIHLPEPERESKKRKAATNNNLLKL